VSQSGLDLGTSKKKKKIKEGFTAFVPFSLKKTPHNSFSLILPLYSETRD
jgi:hypothetical protein